MVLGGGGAIFTFSLLSDVKEWLKMGQLRQPGFARRGVHPAAPVRSSAIYRLLSRMAGFLSVTVLTANL